MSALTIGSFITVRVVLRRVNSEVSDQKTARSVYSRHYAFIHTDGEDDLWESIYEGAMLRGEDLDAYVEYFGRDLTVGYSLDELLEIAIMSDVDGIILDGEGSDETAGLIGEATAKKIPVVTVMSDCADSDRVSFVGFSSYNMGRQYGSQILKHYSGDNMRVYVIMDYERDSSGQDLVISGIYDEFADKGLSGKCDVESIYVHDATAFNAEEDIRDIFMGRSLPNACIALNSAYTRALFQAVVDYNRVGDIYLYGFNDSNDILEAVGKNLLEATVSVNAQSMGMSAVEALDEYINTGYVSDYISQDTRIILAGDLESTDAEQTAEN